jgi:hypothetical protein
VLGINDFRSGEMPYFVAERPYLGTLVQPIFDEIPPALQSFEPCRTRESPQLLGFALKRFLSIFRDLIFDSRVDRGMPNFAAAPVGPNTRPRLAFRASSICPSLALRVFEEAQCRASILTLEAAKVTSFRRSKKCLARKVLPNAG